MSRDLAAELTNLLVSHALTGVRPAAAGDGVDLTTWKVDGAYQSPLVVLFLDGTVAAGVTAPTGGTTGAEVWGYTAVDTSWRLIGLVNAGGAIAIVGANKGYAQRIDVMGIFDRLFIAATASAGTVTAKFAPLDAYS